VKERRDLAIDCRVATSRTDLEAAFRLVYAAYRTRNLTEGSPTGLRLTLHQLLPTSHVVLAERGNQLVATLSLVRDGGLGLPMESICGPEVAALRQRRETLAQVTSFAARTTPQLTSLAATRQALAFVAQLAVHHGVHRLLAAVHPHHARVYTRWAGFTRLGPLRAAPDVRNHPAVPLGVCLRGAKWQLPTEYERFFGVPFPQECLNTHPLSDQVVRHFEQQLQQTGDDSPLAAA
jgi:hypothetical protein